MQFVGGCGSKRWMELLWRSWFSLWSRRQGQMLREGGRGSQRFEEHGGG